MVPVAAAVGPYRGKRILDLVVLAGLALPALILAAPCAIAVRVTSPGPVLFRQERIGRDGHPFQLLKFRTMTTGRNALIPDQADITRVGAVLRRLSFDELPQLVNVARGEMSIIGPRPTLAYQVERYTETQRRRLLVNPGVTGWAQLQGRNEIPWARRIELDLEYIDQLQSPGRDLSILVRSVLAALKGGGVEGHPVEDPIARPPEEDDDRE